MQVYVDDGPGRFIHYKRIGLLTVNMAQSMHGPCFRVRAVYVDITNDERNSGAHVEYCSFQFLMILVLAEQKTRTDNVSLRNMYICNISRGLL